jgi:pyruvate dehydrogenase E2 component (dihydrolipoamide acetyltransferase)
MSPIRKTISVRLSESSLQKPSAALTTTVDAAGILALREMYIQRGIKLSIDAILAKVAGRTLTSNRIINSVLEDEVILLRKEVNVGVAVDTPKGLMVPVLRDADTTPLAEMNENLSRMVREARESQLAAPEMTGGTFTITNLGAFGVEQFTPVINPPECCILAIGAIKSEFVPGVDDQPVLRKRFQLTLVFDHRIVDGAPAAKFLRDFKVFAENPLLLI